MKNQGKARSASAASGVALAMALGIAFPGVARANAVTPPPVPGNIEVKPPNVPFLIGHGVGTQNYVCLPSGAGVAFALFTPEATLFTDDGKQLTSHFFSPNPDEDNTNPAVFAIGAIRATWRHSRDSSSVWAQVKPGDSSTEAPFVAPNAVAWLRLTVVGHEDGPTGGDTLSKTTFIQRVNTAGGVAPFTGCASTADIGHLAFVPYTADYVFYALEE